MTVRILGLLVLLALKASPQGCPSGLVLHRGRQVRLVERTVEFFSCVGRFQHGVMGVAIHDPEQPTPAIWRSGENAMLRHPPTDLETVLAGRTGLRIVLGVQTGGKAVALNLLEYDRSGLRLADSVTGVAFRKMQLRGEGGVRVLVFESLPDDMAWGVPDLLAVRGAKFVHANNQCPGFFLAYGLMLESRSRESWSGPIAALDHDTASLPRQCRGVLTAMTRGNTPAEGRRFCNHAIARISHAPQIDDRAWAELIAACRALIAGGRN